MSICFLIAEGMLPPLLLQHFTLRHHVHRYFCRSSKSCYGRSHVGTFCNSHSASITVKDMRIFTYTQDEYFKIVLFLSTTNRLAKYNIV